MSLASAWYFTEHGPVAVACESIVRFQGAWPFTTCKHGYNLDNVCSNSGKHVLIEVTLASCAVVNFWYNMPMLIAPGQWCCIRHDEIKDGSEFSRL